jgi:hypothetical protein
MPNYTLWTILGVAMALGACSSGPDPETREPNLELLKQEWGLRLKESETLAKQRAGILPEPLEAFASEDPSACKNARSKLEFIEKEEPGFVYARVLELLPASVDSGADGSRAREELIEIGSIIRLASLFRSDNPDDWTEARTALARLGSKGVDTAAVRLIVKLRNHDPEILERVQKEILALHTGAVRHLVLAVTSPRVASYIKERCIDLLVRIGPGSMPALLPLLEEKTDRSARYYTAKAIGRLGDPAAVEALAAAEAGETDPLVRCMMIEALAALRGPRALAAAIRAVADEDLSVVKFGAKALALLGAREGVSALVDALERTGDDSMRDVRNEILKALRLVTGLPGGADPAWWRERLGD